jgi:hypothetical protein
LGVTTAPLILFLHTEFAETADEDVFAVLQRLLDELKESFDNLCALAFGEDILGKQILNNMRFR